MLTSSVVGFRAAGASCLGVELNCSSLLDCELCRVFSPSLFLCRARVAARASLELSQGGRGGPRASGGLLGSSNLVAARARDHVAVQERLRYSFSSLAPSDTCSCPRRGPPHRR